MNSEGIVEVADSEARNGRCGIRVFIVAPPMVSRGFERLIEGSDASMEWVGSAASLASGLDAAARVSCDVLVAALQAGDDYELIARQPLDSRARVLVVSGEPDLTVLDKVIHVGARGVVHTSDRPAVLLKAIEKVNDGELWINRAAASRIFLEMTRKRAVECADPEKTKIATLTGRERQMVAAVARDASAPAKVIAGRMCISEHTLRNHLTSIYSKLDLSSRLDLYAYAVRHFLVDNLISS